MSLLCIGISHKTSVLKVREKFSFTRNQLEQALINLRDSRLALGAVILSTCNRAEIYVEVDNETSACGDIKECIFAIFNAKDNRMKRYFYILKDRDAIRHIFRVASGLDSQVLGENQILAQVRLAWGIAKEMEATSNALDEIFIQAEKIGKNIRTETKISQGNISIGSVAIKMMQEKINNLQAASVLVIGAGKVGSLISNYLREKNIRTIFVASRNYARALELASRCGGRAIDFTRLQDELRSVNIVISSTASPHLILKHEMLVNAMRLRKEPLVILDLALPRDVDPLAREIQGISLYDLDDLKCVVEENYKMRQREAVLAEILIERKLEIFINNREEVSVDA